jgi:hypothetical protein
MHACSLPPNTERNYMYLCSCEKTSMHEHEHAKAWHGKAYARVLKKRWPHCDRCDLSVVAHFLKTKKLFACSCVLKKVYLRPIVRTCIRRAWNLYAGVCQNAAIDAFGAIIRGKNRWGGPPLFWLWVLTLTPQIHTPCFMHKATKIKTRSKMIH